MKLLDSYDWVVLGDHPAALLSGALVAKLGLSVLMLPSSLAETKLEGESNFLMGLGKWGQCSGLLSECLEYLEISPSEAAKIESDSVVLQILGPEMRFSFYSEDEKFKTELLRELEGALDGQRFWFSALEALRGGLSGADIQEWQLQHAVVLMALGRTAASFQGGLRSYRQLLIDLGKRHGAHVHPAPCQRVLVEKRQVRGVQVAHTGTMLGVRGVVVGYALDHLRPLLTSDRYLNRSPLPIGWRFTLSIQINRDAIPPGMTRRLIWKEEGAPYLEFELDFSKPQVTLYLRTQFPFSAETLDSKFQQLMAARMLRQAEEVLPFLDQHILGIYPDFRNSREELEWEYSWQNLNEIPENLRCFDGKGLGIATGMDGLFLVTGESFPEWGSFGPVIAALESTAWIGQHCLDHPLENGTS